MTKTTKYIQAALPIELADWVDSTFQHGQKAAFIEACFENLRILMTEGTLPPPSEYARLATVETVKKWASNSGE